MSWLAKAVQLQLKLQLQLGGNSPSRATAVSGEFNGHKKCNENQRPQKQQIVFVVAGVVEIIVVMVVVVSALLIVVAVVVVVVVIVDLPNEFSGVGRDV